MPPQSISAQSPEEHRQGPLLAGNTASPNMDFLRASAVLMVVIFHLIAYFGFTHLGALHLGYVAFAGFVFFFAHSSFVLMLSLERQLCRLGSKKLFLIFMTRRCLRIYPLSIFIISAIVLFRLPLTGSPWEMHWPAPSSREVVADLLLVQNLTGTTDLQGPLWSLPIEMQMCVFLPALFVLSRKVRSLSLHILAWGLVTAAVYIRVVSGHGYLTRFFPCFLAGVIAYRISTQQQPRLPFAGWPLLLWGLSILFATLHNFPACWSICFVVAIMAPHFRPTENHLLRSASHFVAKYSYGFYLAHYFCIWLAFTKLRFLPVTARSSIFVVCLLTIPVVLYHAIEAPFIKAGKFLFESARVHEPERGAATESVQVTNVRLNPEGCRLGSAIESSAPPVIELKIAPGQPQMSGSAITPILDHK